ncbi:MAG: hypothetical protein V8S34_09145 [Lawsonibacter sp.]
MPHSDGDEHPCRHLRQRLRLHFVIFMGIPTTFLYNLLAGVIRSLGDSKTPVYFLALSSY